MSPGTAPAHSPTAALSPAPDGHPGLSQGPAPPVHRHGGPDDRVPAPAHEQGRRGWPESGADFGAVLPVIGSVGRVALPTPTAYDDRARNTNVSAHKSARHCEPVRAWQSPGTSLEPVRFTGSLPRRFAPHNDVVTYGCSFLC